MKKTKPENALQKSGILKVLLFMKLTIAILLISLVQVSAKGYSQSKITLKLTNAELTKVLLQIEKKSNFRFLYNDDAISLTNPKVDVNVANTPVTEVLNSLFAGTNLTYKVLNNNLIVLSAKDNLIQDIKVTGRVLGSNGEPVPAATIRVKGTTVVTSADINGRFSIVSPDNAVLVVSSVGFSQEEVPVSGRKEINVTLKESEKVLDQVVVIGYGTANKRDLTGSIVKISGKEVADKPNTNPIASLQGKVAGLSVVNNGTPGAAPDIRIRGTVSIGQVHPLYIVDGIFNDNIDYINPNDIESIEVLKDPSSLAIFGVKGATGAIVITTKRAKVGQTVINFNTTYGTKKLVDKIKMVDAAGFSTLFAEENANNGVATPGYSQLTANTDWIDAVTRKANFTTSNLSVSGSTDRNKFNLGLGYTYDEGIVKHEQLSKMLLSLSDEYKVTKTLKVGTNLNVTRQNNPYDVTASGTDVLNSARKVMPQISANPSSFKIQDPYGTDSVTTNLYSTVDPALQSGGVQNPLIQLENEWNKTINITLRTVGSVYAELNFLKNFNFKSTFYADISSQDERQYKPLYNAYNPLDNSIVLISPTTSVTQTTNTYKRFQQDEILTYRKNFGGHSITAMGGFTTFYSGNTSLQGVATQASGVGGVPIPNDSRFWYVSNGFTSPQNQFSTSSQSEYTTVSYLARVLYNYQGKYFLNGSLRDDASSQIPTINRHQQFWALGAGWEISKENFMKDQHFFDFLKLKGSVGVLGNQSATQLDGTPINYPQYPGLISGSTAVFGTGVVLAAQPAYIANPNLKWETVNAQEIGVEFNAFQNRLHFEANYFNKQTNNLMTYVSRATIGQPDELINGGSIKNWGEEFAASWIQKISNDFTLNVSGNITFLKNRVLSLSADLPTGTLDVTSQNNGTAISETKAGMPIGYFKGYVETGLYQSYADILSSPSEASLGAARPGDTKYKDVNGDGVINASDRTMIGNPTPKFTYGSTITLTYKGLSLGIDVGGVYGNQVYRTWGALESPFQRVNYAAFEQARWHGAGTSNWVPILSQGDRINYVGSNYSIEDGSYFRIRNVQLGYNIPSNLITKFKINALRVFANVQNLKTWKNNSGYTPEFGGNATSFGYDNGGGAIPMVSTLGLNVTF
jgi:TonB-linked SusC/RagA family outer membrane protein